MRWITRGVIALLSVYCLWLLVTRGEEAAPGFTEPFIRVPLAPFILLAAAVLLAAGWHQGRRPDADAVPATTGSSRRWLGAIVAFWIVSVPVWHEVGGRVSGEGMAYYVYLRSAVFDGDLDFSNEYEAYNLDDVDPRLVNNPTPTGVPRNVHAVGPAVVWVPFLAIGQALEGLGTAPRDVTAFDSTRRPRDALIGETYGPGYSYSTVTATAFGSIVLLGLASVLWYREMARTLAPRDAAVGVIGVIVAGPLLWYTFFEPSMSHAPTAACLVFAMVAWRGWARNPAAGRALLVGLAAGLLAMQRWQFILWTIVPAGHLLIMVVRRARRSAASREPQAAAEDPMVSGALVAAGHLGLMVLGTVIGLLPQFLAWKLVWGSWVHQSMGSGYMLWSTPELFDVLWSQRHGLFTWHPVLLLAVVGFIPAWKWDRTLTGVCLGLLLVRGCPTGSRKSAATVNSSYPTFCISATLSSSRSRCAFSIQRCS